MGKQFPAYNPGTCLKDQNHKWNKDDKIYWDKTQDGRTIICNNLECFKSQGGQYEEGQQKKQGRTIDMSLAFAKAFDDYAWKLANAHAKELYPDGSCIDKDMLLKQRGIAVESIYSTLVQGFNGKS